MTYASLSEYDAAMTAAELASEQRQPPAPSPSGDRQADAASAWQTFIATAIERSERKTLTTAMEAVGECIIEREAKLRAEFEARLEVALLKLRNEFLADQLDVERGIRRLKPAVPIDSSKRIA
jgi:hypothetical protein